LSSSDLPSSDEVDQPMSTGVHRWRMTLHRIRPRDLLTIAHVAVVLAVVESLIRYVALPRLCELLGFRLALTPASGDAVPLPATELPARAQRQLRYTNLVTESWPLSRGPCLRRSLVAGRLLRRLDPALRVGVVGTGESLIGHAWLEVHERPLEDVTTYAIFQSPIDPAR
jgi:hypothetical protein